jgi:hypothetical protein
MNPTNDVDSRLLVTGKSFRRGTVKKSYLDSGITQEQIDRRNLVKQKLRIGDCDVYGGIGMDDSDDDDYLSAQLGLCQPGAVPPAPVNEEDCSPYCSGSKEATGFSLSGGLLRWKSTTPRTSKKITKWSGQGSDNDDSISNHSSRVISAEKKRPTKSNMQILSSSEHGQRSKTTEGFSALTKSQRRNPSFGGINQSNSSRSWHSRSSGIHLDTKNHATSVSPSLLSRKSSIRNDIFERQSPRRHKSLGSPSIATTMGLTHRNANVSKFRHSHDDENNLTLGSPHSMGRSLRHREEKILQHRESPEMNRLNATVPNRSHSNDDERKLDLKSPAKSFSWGGKGCSKSLLLHRGKDRTVGRAFPNVPRMSGTDRDTSDTEEASYSGRSNVNTNCNVGREVLPMNLLQKERIYNNAVRRAQERQSQKCARPTSQIPTGSSSGRENRILKAKTAKECDDYGFVSASDSEDDDIDSMDGHTRKSSSGPSSSDEPSIFQRGLLALERIYDDLNI